MKSARITPPIYNLGCGGGGTLAIERALTKVAGVLQAYVNPLTEMVYIVYDPDTANPEQLASSAETQRGLSSMRENQAGNRHTAQSAYLVR